MEEENPYKRRAKELLGDSWAEFLWHEFKKSYLQKMNRIVKKDRKLLRVYPDKEDVFRAFRVTPFTNVRVVIVGQDPYHNGMADGLAFSSRGDIVPRSLQNIFKEIQSDLDIEVESSNPDLTRWAVQGVFLINTSLTVRKGNAGSHSGLGWETFVGRAIKVASLAPTPTVFMLWGNHAQNFRQHIEETNHLVLEAYHPSPLSASRGFFGCEHFSQCNNFLTDNNLNPINWK